MSSVNAITAIPNITAYNASKGGVDNLTRNMALSLAQHRIRVNAIAPGSVKTEVFQQVATDRAKLGSILARTPIGRVAEPVEIANVALFLSSPLSTYMTGQVVYVDGGRLALNYTCPIPDNF